MPYMASQGYDDLLTNRIMSDLTLRIHTDQEEEKRGAYKGQGFLATVDECRSENAYSAMLERYGAVDIKDLVARGKIDEANVKRLPKRIIEKMKNMDLSSSVQRLVDDRMKKLKATNLPSWE